MIWTRSDTLALANQKCAKCHGLGLRDISKEEGTPCNCVLREIFRVCFRRFVEAITQEKHLSHSRLERRPGKAGHVTWARVQEEYIADFKCITERTLPAPLLKIFRYHFLLGADYNLCCRKLQIDKGTFFHAVYRIEQRLGRAFRETEPYSLYPLDEYFGGKIKSMRPLRPGQYRGDTGEPSLSRRVPLPKAA